jgi:hypothetical protein
MCQRSDREEPNETDWNEILNYGTVITDGEDYMVKYMSLAYWNYRKKIYFYIATEIIANCKDYRKMESR